MANIDLNQIAPRTGTFTIPRGDSEKKLTLRPFNLMDEAWLKDTFGDRVDSIFKDGSNADFCRIAFHQLCSEDQADFVKQKVTIVDEEGNSEVMEIGGYKLLQAQIIGPKPKRGLITAVWETLGVSRPLIDELRALEAGADKKKVTKIGQKSSIPFRTNMDGRPSTSSRARRGKSRGGSKK